MGSVECGWRSNLEIKLGEDSFPGVVCPSGMPEVQSAGA